MPHSNTHSNSQKVLRSILAIVQVVILVVLVRVLINPKTSETDDQSPSTAPIALEDIQVLFPQARSFELSDKGDANAYDAQGGLLGFAFLSEPSSHVGFAGPTPMVIALDTSLRLHAIALRPNAETPGYLSRVERSGFIQQWQGMTPQQVVAHSVDAVSGATLSSSCIAQTLQNTLTLRLERGDLHYDSMSKASQGTGSLWSWIKHGLNILVLLWALSCFFWPKTFKPSRLYLLGTTMIVLGFLQGKLISLSLLEQWAIHDIFSPQAWFLMLLAALAIILPMFTGKRFYCFYVCPFGAAQELAGKLFKRYHVKLTAPRTKLLSYLRQIYLLSIVTLLVLGIVTDLSIFEPFTAFLPETAHQVSMIIAGVMTLVSMFIPRFWCRFLCPTGFIIEQFQIHRK